MFRSNLFRVMVAAISSLAISGIPLAAAQNSNSSQDKHLDIQSSAGDLHLGTDADARKAGLPLYPGAKPQHDENNSNANIGLLTDAFGIKLVVAKYASGDDAGKIADFYREQLKKFGKVLECHTHRSTDEAHADIDDNNDSKHKDKSLKCEGDNTGPVTELKVGTEDNQHVVSVEPDEGHAGTKFTLVYVHTRGKQGDI
jgi:hypothetical protein